MITLTEDYLAARRFRCLQNQTMLDNDTFGRALRNAMSYAQDDDIENFVVITVEGYYCVAYVRDEWQPIKIDDIVFPFDNYRIYPMQKAQLSLSFVYNY